MASNSTDKTKEKIQIPFSCLPSNKEVYFHESSFFTRYGIDKLRSPAKVRSLQKVEDFGYPPPMRFQEMGLLVKYGRLINIGERQCLWIVRQFLRDSVPVPEIYGWVVDGDETFIYMELLDGNTLKERWASLSSVDRVRLCGELRDMVTSLRRLEQLPSERFVGRVARQPLDDVTFTGVYEGPWETVKDFNDWFAELPRRGFDVTFDDPFRRGLVDDAPICFTHNDLHPSNILITSKGTPHILALVDLYSYVLRAIPRVFSVLYILYQRPWLLSNIRACNQ